MSTSIGRSLQILEEVSTATARPTHADLLRKLKIPKSTLSGILAELRALGYVSSIDGRYSPGPRLLSLAFLTTGSMGAIGSIHPILEAITASTRETSLFAILSGGAAVCVDKVDSPEPVRYVPDLGAERPITTTALGKVLLAWHPDMQPTPRTVLSLPTVDQEQLLTELETTRQRGYALNIGESQPGVSAVAVPVHSPDGDFVGAMSVTGPTSRTPDILTHLRPLVDALRSGGYRSQLEG